MPAKVRKVKGGYRVSTPHGVKAKKTSRRKAYAQAAIINRAHRKTGK